MSSNSGVALAPDSPDFVRPLYLAWPEYVRTFGDDVCDFAEQVGRPMDEEQRLVLRIIYSVREDDTPAAFEVALIAARQNLKTATFEVAALYDLYVAKSPLGVWTAHKYDTTKESFLNIKAMVDSYDFLTRRTEKIIEAIGDQHIQTVSRCRLRFRARSMTGGRGLTTKGRLFLDEAFALKDTHTGSVIPTLATFRSAQVLYGSSAGRADSDYLRGVRDRGRARLGRIGYAEWAVPTGTCRQLDCRHEKSFTDEERAAKGCALDDPKLLRQANPSMEWPGRKVWRISQEFIAGERQALSPLEFGREQAGWWEEPGLMSLFAGWGGLRDDKSVMVSRLAFTVTVDRDRSLSVIAAAGLRPPEADQMGPFCAACEHESCHGSTHVEPVDVRPGTGWVTIRMRELLRRHGRCPVVIATSSPAGALIPELRREGVEVTDADSGQVMDADAQFFDQVTQGTVRHRAYPELDSSIERAMRRPVGKRWVFDARDPDQEVTVLQGVSLAAWASRNVERPRSRTPMFASV